VDVVLIAAGIVAVPDELELEFNLVALDRRTANRALKADSRPSPDAVWPSVG
jgi:hypothetical protein